MRTRAQEDADGGGEARLTLTVNVHISADTTVEVTTHPGQGLATVTFEGRRHATDVTLFLHTPELRELRDLLTDTLTGLTENADRDPITDGDGGRGGVSDRAA